MSDLQPKLQSQLPADTRWHGCVGDAEHDPQRSLYHGCCRTCLEQWPCAWELERREVYRTAPVRAGQAAEQQRYNRHVGGDIGVGL